MAKMATYLNLQGSEPFPLQVCFVGTESPNDGAVGGKFPELGGDGSNTP